MTERALKKNINWVHVARLSCQSVNEWLSLISLFLCHIYRSINLFVCCFVFADVLIYGSKLFPYVHDKRWPRFTILSTCITIVNLFCFCHHIRQSFSYTFLLVGNNNWSEVYKIRLQKWYWNTLLHIKWSLFLA